MRFLIPVLFAILMLAGCAATPFQGPPELDGGTQPDLLGPEPGCIAPTPGPCWEPDWAGPNFPSWGAARTWLGSVTRVIGEGVVCTNPVQTIHWVQTAAQPSLAAERWFYDDNGMWLATIVWQGAGAPCTTLWLGSPLPASCCPAP
jgi:hypothetical protein